MLGSMRLLATGFEPFGTDSCNASEEVLRLLPGQTAGHGISTVVLPVSFARAGQVLAAAVAEFQPEALLCLGEAGGRTAITPEACAVNLDDARIPDNDGAQPRRQRISNGARVLAPALDPARFARAAAAAGIPAEVSQDAGAFLCNHVAYLAYAGNVPALFVHVPAVRPEGAVPLTGSETDAAAPQASTLGFADLARGIAAGISTF